MKRSGVPAHAVIEQHLREVIGTAAPGDQLPSDRELCEQFDVSRMTARQAIAALVAEGRVYRVRGSGTFVARNPVHRRVSRLLSFTEHMRRAGRVPSARVLRSGHRTGSRQENLDLGQASSAEVYELGRLLLGDDVPIAVEDVLLPTDCAAVLDADLETGSLHGALADLGREPVRAKGTLSAESADSETARWLDVALGSALVVQRQRVLDADDRPVALVVARYVGERFVFDIDQEKHVYADPAEHDREPSYEIKALSERSADGRE